LIQLLKNGNV